MKIYLLLAFLLFPASAYAYVDAGFLSLIYQAAYILIFGFLAFFIFKPWNYLKSFFKRKHKEEKKEDIEQL